jgi:integrase
MYVLFLLLDLFGRVDAHREYKMRRKPTSVQLFDNLDDKHDGTIIRKKGSNKLYVLFYYCGRRVEKTTGLDDSAANRKKVRTWLDRQMEKIEAGNFKFSDAFPSALDSDKAWFAQQEGWNYAPDPRSILIGEYLDKWDKEIVSFFDSSSQRDDYRAIVSCWVKPHFAKMSFYELTKFELKKFVATLKHKIGPKKGTTLSRSRVANIVSIVRILFNDACDEFHWEIPDPFRKIDKLYPKIPPQVRDIFRYDEWLLILDAIPQWHRPMLEMMMLTGMIHSEISGLLRSHIRKDHIFLQQSIVRKVEKPYLKEVDRTRKVPITKRIREILDVALARTDSQYVFAKPNGTPYLRENFTERTWKTAIGKCDIPYRPPYSIRHSFAAWSLLAGVQPLRLVNLMGHASKRMVYEVYGDYVEGLEEDFWNILEYFGKDFVETKKRPPIPHYNFLSESFGESQGSQRRNQLITLNK